jgi:hypothetical protein
MKRSSRHLVFVSISVFLVILILLFKFVFISEEKRIEATLKKAVDAVRNEDVDACMEVVAISRWDSVEMKTGDVRQILEEGFSAFDNIRVLYDDFEALVEGEEATARFKAKVIARYDDQVVLLLGTLTEGTEIELGLVKEGNRWLIHSLKGVEIPLELLEEF